ncbi:MAG: hypothetical protein AAGD14_04320 [Planctomycetota bacterium]
MLDVDVRKLTWGVLGTLGGVILIFFAVFYLYFGDRQSDPLPEAARPDHATIREELDNAANRRLMTFGWVDREKGIVRIPIEDAIEKVLAERGTK